MRAVSNSGPIIHLSWIDRLDILSALFQEVLIPVAVRDEVLRANAELRGVPAVYAAVTSGQFKIHPIQNRNAAADLEAGLGRGEAEAIVLMEETGADLLLLDDRQARTRAQARNLPITGTVGILRIAQERGLIVSAMPFLDELKQLGFRISAALLETIRQDEERRGQ